MSPENQAELENFIFDYFTRNPAGAYVEQNRLVILDEKPAQHYYFASALHTAGFAKTFDVDYTEKQVVIEFRDAYADAARRAVETLELEREKSQRQPWESEPWQPPAGPSF